MAMTRYVERGLPFTVMILCVFDVWSEETSRRVSSPQASSPSSRRARLPCVMRSRTESMEALKRLLDRRSCSSVLSRPLVVTCLSLRRSRRHLRRAPIAANVVAPGMRQPGPRPAQGNEAVRFIFSRWCGCLWVAVDASPEFTSARS
jgi:hypothetical protein